jgi:AraC family transcriptional regulator, L-rhamnose operon regulatory protein RhaS
MKKRTEAAPYQGIISLLPGHPWTSLLPELRMLAWETFQRARSQGLRAHTHVAYEFTYIIEGSVSWWLEQQRVDFGRGELFFTRPGELHGGTNEAMHPCQMLWMQVLIPESGKFLDWSPAMLAQLLAGLSGSELRRFPMQTDFMQTYFALMREHQCPSDSYSVISASSLLSSLLIQTVRARDAARADQQNGQANISPLITSAMTWMREHVAESYTMQDVARHLGLHPSRFHDRFVVEVGQPPAEWRMRQRIAEAEKMLRAPNARVTQIAHELGFTSSQYFATAFKKYTGHTPSAYRGLCA